MNKAPQPVWVIPSQGQQEQQEAKGQEKIEGQQEKVIPAKTELKRPSRK
jgi:hypothetical protein